MLIIDAPALLTVPEDRIRHEWALGNACMKLGIHGWNAARGKTGEPRFVLDADYTKVRALAEAWPHARRIWECSNHGNAFLYAAEHDGGELSYLGYVGEVRFLSDEDAKNYHDYTITSSCIRLGITGYSWEEV